MRSNPIRMLLSVILLTCMLTMLGAITGCSLFKPTPQGACPTLTTSGAELVAYGASLAAVKGGAKTSDLVLIESNITATVSSGQFNADLISIAIKNAGGAPWLQCFGAVDAIFGAAFNSIVNSNLSAQVCSVPVAKAIAEGIDLYLALAPTKGAQRATAAYRPTLTHAQAEARLQELLSQQ